MIMLQFEVYAMEKPSNTTLLFWQISPTAYREKQVIERVIENSIMEFTGSRKEYHEANKDYLCAVKPHSKLYSLG